MARLSDKLQELNAGKSRAAQKFNAMVKRAKWIGPRPEPTATTWVQQVEEKCPKCKGTGMWPSSGFAADEDVCLECGGDGSVLILRPIAVKAMEDGHLVRWVAHFRQKTRRGHGNITDHQIDLYLRSTMVTAPAIYSEIWKRGLDAQVNPAPWTAKELAARPPEPTQPTLPDPYEPTPGKRLITFDE